MSYILITRQDSIDVACELSPLVFIDGVGTVREGADMNLASTGLRGVTATVTMAAVSCQLGHYANWG